MIEAPAINATATLDPTDVPRVDAAHLARMLAMLVDGNHVLTMLVGGDRAAMESLQAAFWRGFDGETATGVATLVRFHALVDVFASRRLASLLMHEGFAVLEAAFSVASGIRLNAARGFNPQGLVWAVTAELAAARRHQGVGHRNADRMAA